MYKSIKMHLHFRSQLAIVGFILIWTMVAQGFIPYSCSFDPPEGCTCVFPKRPKVTCHPKVPLNAFPEVTENMSAIHTLDLSDNNITAVEEPVCQNCVSLRMLVLSNNKMKRFSESTLQGLIWPSALQYLDLSHNEFSTTTQIYFLKHFVDLKVLKLNHNKLVFFHYDEILPKLRELHLDNNPLTYFGIDSAALTTLTLSFDPYNSEMAKLSTLNAKNLRSVHFKDTATEILKMDWDPTSKLQYLGMENAHLEDTELADIKFYHDSNSLEALSLTDNRLDLQRSYFKNFAKRIKGVKYLDMSFNLIKKIEASTFKDLNNLETLLLNHNRIKDINWNFLSHLNHLKKLDLRNNRIKSTELLKENLMKLPRFHTLLIGDNLFDCACPNEDLLELISMQRNGEFHILDPLEIRHSMMCASPPVAAGHLVANVNITRC